jgi:hypothetical protein
MAVAVIGGLISSTLLSLVFVPAVFAVMDDFGSLTWRLFSRFVGAVDEPPQGSPHSVQAAPGAEPATLHIRPVAAE